MSKKFYIKSSDFKQVIKKTKGSKSKSKTPQFKTPQFKTSNLYITDPQTNEINLDVTRFTQQVAAFASKDTSLYSEGKEYVLDTHVSEAYIAVTSRWKHLRDTPLDFFLMDFKVSVMFARLVALCIRTSRSISGKNYELNKNYVRINLEKKKVMNYFRDVRFTERRFIPPNLDSIRQSVRKINKFRGIHFKPEVKSELTQRV